MANRFAFGSARAEVIDPALRRNLQARPENQ